MLNKLDKYIVEKITFANTQNVDTCINTLYFTKYISINSRELSMIKSLPKSFYKMRVYLHNKIYLIEVKFINLINNNWTTFVLKTNKGNKLKVIYENNNEHRELIHNSIYKIYDFMIAVYNYYFYKYQD